MSQLLLRRFPAHRCGGGRGGHAHAQRRLLCTVVVGPQYGGGERRRGPRQEEESRAVKVSVWWDFENCNVPNNINVCRVAPRVSAALRAAGIRGPLSITAFGDVLQLSRSSQEALVDTGVSISHVPSSGKNSSDRSFMADLAYWIAQNPPPAHFFLISGDKDFANILHRLRMSNYNILLACPSRTTSVLRSAATIVWPWEALVKGEDFLPKRFNHPPDGISGSWYGHYKGALDDPFLDSESEEAISMPGPSDYNEYAISKQPVNATGSKECTVPKHAVDAIREALNQYPNGVSLPNLRFHLKSSNVFLGDDFFGHKKFSSLLQAMPNIVKFVNRLPGENQLCVVGVNKRLLEPAKQSSKPVSSAKSNIRDSNLNQTAHNDKTPPSSVSTSFSESTVRDKSFTQNENPPTFVVSSSPQNVLSEDQKKCPTDLNARPETPADKKEDHARAAPGTPSFSGLENTVKNDGLLKRIWVLWNGPERSEPKVPPLRESTSAEVVNDFQSHQKHRSASQRRKLLKRLEKRSSEDGSSDGTDITTAAVSNVSTSSDNDISEKLKHGKVTEMLKSDPSTLQKSVPCSEPSSVPMDDTSKMSRGIFSWATGWWKFGKSDADKSTTNNNAADIRRADSTEDCESLKASTFGSGQELVHEIFTKFYFWDVLEQHLSKPLGSELVSKAKTREELVQGLQKLDCWPLKGLGEKDLRQLVQLLVAKKKWIEETPCRDFPFRLTLPQKRTCVPSNSSKSDSLSSLFSNLNPLQSHDRSRTGRPLTREEILSDCHKALKDLLVRNEYGFDLGIFKDHFARRHGYELDHKKLGYPDLESLMQIMPGVKVNFPMVIPAEHGNGQAGSKGSGNQSINGDEVWEELGPVSATTETAEGGGKEMCYLPPTPSEDEFSENEDHADQQPRREPEQSSLLQIIDSWNTSKEDGSRKKPQDIDGLVDCSRGSKPGYVDSLMTQKPATRLKHKQYSFVSDSSSEEEDKEKDNLVETVLGTLQKGRGSKELHH